MTFGVTADFRVFDPDNYVLPGDYGVLKAELADSCHEHECNLTFKFVDSDRQQKLMLEKRFELHLENEVCHHYTSTNATMFAGIRYCTPHNSTIKKFDGTFFDEENARYDLEVANDTRYYRVARYRKAASDTWQRGMDMDGDLKPGIGALHYTDSTPVLDTMKHATIELVIGIEESFALFFNHDWNIIHKYVGLCVVSVDAIYRQMKVRVKLVGLRDWTKMGLTASQNAAESHLSEIRTFLFGNDFTPGVVDYKARRGWDRISGVPDTVITFTHRPVRESNHILGLAYRIRQSWGATGIVMPQHANLLSLRNTIPMTLHHFANSIVTAHEIGHTLTLVHADPESPDCRFPNGHCIMTPRLTWPLPLWRPVEEKQITGNLEGSHSFLKQQNVRHADMGTVHYGSSVSHATIKMLYFTTIGSALVAVFILFQFAVSQAGHQRDQYNRLHDHES